MGGERVRAIDIKWWYTVAAEIHNTYNISWKFTDLLVLIATITRDIVG
jgi:hypothetical protein